MILKKFQLFLKCIYYWPEDGRPYVALGKILGKQSKTSEARAVYEKGCQATQGENPYIWQVSLILGIKFERKAIYAPWNIHSTSTLQ